MPEILTEDGCEGSQDAALCVWETSPSSGIFELMVSRTLINSMLTNRQYNLRSAA